MPHVWRVVVSAVAAGLLLAGCSGSTSSTPEAGPDAPAATPTSPSSPSASTPTQDPVADPPPPAHACYRLAYPDALAPTLGTNPVRCTQPHTAVNYYVGKLGSDISANGPQAQRIASTDCPRRFASVVGGTLEDRRLSLLRAVWFTPDPEQADLGARWYSCVALALQGDQQLATLGRVAGALDSSAGRTRYGLCGTAQPGTAGFEQRICSTPHTWRALRTVGFPPGGYPGLAQVRAAGQTPCKDAGQQASNDPLSYRWSYQWPTPRQWRAGQTYGVCWVPAS